MKFSVVIPLYNKASHIQRALDSVLNQGIKDFECIVINDGSTDGSEEIVKLYTDKRIKLITQENKGEAAARNTGIRKAKGDFVAFLDADDEWEADFLSIISELILNYPQAGVFATALAVKERNGYFTKYRYKTLPDHPWNGLITNYFECLANADYPLSSSSTVINSSLLPIIGNFDTSLKIGADIDMWCRAALNTEIAFSSTVGATYYRDADNRSDVRLDHLDREKEFIDKLEKYNSHPKMIGELLVSFNKFRLKKLESIIIRYINSNQKIKARSILASNRHVLGHKEKYSLILRLLTPNYVRNLIKQRVRSNH